MQPIFEMQEELQRRAGKPKREFAVKERDAALLQAVEKSIGDGIEKALAIKGKKERAAAVYAVSDKVVADLAEKFPDRSKEIIDACDYLVRTRVRLAILDDDKRIDDRKSTDIRPHQRRGAGAPAHARLRGLHPRRDPGARDRHARHFLR